MSLRVRTFAIVTAAALATGGISWAVMSATVTGRSVVATTPVQTGALQLTVDTADIDPITLTDVKVPIIARNPAKVGTEPLVIPNGSLAVPELTVFANLDIDGDCNPDSFTVGAPVNYTLKEVKPQRTAVVAYLPVTFHDLDEDQNACVGAHLSFAWAPQTIG